jgi:hypothetical protein
MKSGNHRRLFGQNDLRRGTESEPMAAGGSDNGNGRDPTNGKSVAVHWKTTR